ncbi:MAG: HEAT repeat domain-containing protein [Chloroflexi bacterium]|nr:HEAT repeat domain-containing protein [Chloroflexota bacterium]
MDFDGDITPPTKPSLDITLAALKAEEPGAVSAAIYYGLSGLTEAELEKLRAVWPALSADYRRKVMQELAETSESNFDLDYRAIGLLGLKDEDAAVREAAIETLWIDESPELMNRLLEMAQWDEANEVRAAALTALGRFVLLGEYEELPESQVTKLQDVIVGLWADEQEDLNVRRRALEAIANSSHEIVPDAIEEAYESREPLLKISAVFAMGRSCDERWKDWVLREMNSPDAELRYEAARAAGEIGITEAIPLLGRLAMGNDRETQEVAIWSLGEIGGREALRILSALAEDAAKLDDDDLIEAVDEALSNASLVGGDIDFDTDDD